MFSDADWRPVVTGVAEAPDYLIPGFTTLTVTIPTESAELRPHRGPTCRYKLRYEALPDLIALINVAQQNLYPLSNIALTWTQPPDGEVAFDADLTLDGLRMLCQQITDGHVMEETVVLEADYTGDRT
jgi:hypothetical protein